MSSDPSNGADEPLCFWTDLQGTAQECEIPIQPSDWAAGGENGHVFIGSPSTVGNPIRLPADSHTPTGFRELVGFERSLQTEIAMYPFYEAYGDYPYAFSGTMENVRIVKLALQDGTALETFAIAGAFAVTLLNQDVNANGYTFRAEMSGELPVLDRAYAWGVLADLAMTPNTPQGRPFRVSFGGTYTFDVPTVMVLDINEYAFPVSPDYEDGGFVYSVWVDSLPCGDGAELSISIDGGPPQRLVFYHGCH